MKITKIVLAASLVASGFALSGCLDDGRPGRWGDRDHGHHRHDRGDRDHHDRYDRDHRR